MVRHNCSIITSIVAITLMNDALYLGKILADNILGHILTLTILLEKDNNNYFDIFPGLLNVTKL